VPINCDEPVIVVKKLYKYQHDGGLATPNSLQFNPRLVELKVQSISYCLATEVKAMELVHFFKSEICNIHH
jgi:hypothetical protein